jgi:3'(2'), 5'-bisphosphate nucleotidase
MSTLTDDRQAAEIAEAAGRLLLELRVSGLTGKELGRLGDRRSNDLILQRLAADRPGDAILSEESADSRERLSAERVWIVDPLDGTREYGMEGRADWAVHVALWMAGQGITAAAVAQPALDLVYATDDQPRSRPHGGSAGGPVVLVSDSRPPEFATSVADAIGGTVRPMGSAGAKAMAVLRGEADAYIHAGGQWEWDSAAPAGVLVAAGFHVSRIDGSPLEYNRPHPYLPDLVMCRPELSSPLLYALEEHSG